MTSSAEAEGVVKYTAETESDTLEEVLVTDAIIEIKIVVGELKSTVTDVKNENAYLKKLNAELVLQIAQLKDQNADLKDGIDFLGDGITDLKDGMGNLKNELGDLKSQMADLKNPALAFIPRVLELRKPAEHLEPSAVEAQEARKNALKQKADKKRAMEGDGSTWLVEE